jgi:peptide/nickel transport system permease protein
MIALYAARRVLHAALVLLATLGALFWLTYVVPGDPASVMLGPRATQEEKASLRSAMQLDQPVPVRLVHFLGQIVRGDLGRDMVTRRPVAALIGDALPHTLALTAFAIVWAVAIGLPAGCWCAVRRGGWGDKAAGILSTGLIALPTAVIGIYALLWFAVGLRWFPAIGAGRADDPADQLRHLVLPSLTIGLAWIGYLTRLSRAAMLEVLNEPHVRTYRAFGVPGAQIVWRHVVPLAIGRLIYDAVLTRNFPVLVGTVLVAAALYLLINLIADLIIASLDPRVRAAL